MSFCVVPPMRASGTSCFFATAAYIARRIAAVALIVIEVVTLSSGMPAKSCSRSARLEIDTPTFPTSPATCSSSAS